MAKAKGSPKTGGRQKGSKNLIGQDVRALALQYVPEAMQELGRLAVEAESEQARVSAIKELNDRAFGKATQPIDATVNSRVVLSIDLS